MRSQLGRSAVNILQAAAGRPIAVLPGRVAPPRQRPFGSLPPSACLRFCSHAGQRLAPLHGALLPSLAPHKSVFSVCPAPPILPVPALPSRPALRCQCADAEPRPHLAAFQVSGASLADYLAAHIFQPAGLSDTFFDLGLLGETGVRQRVLLSGGYVAQANLTSAGMARLMLGLAG